MGWRSRKEQDRKGGSREQMKGLWPRMARARRTGSQSRDRETWVAQSLRVRTWGHKVKVRI